VLDLIDLHTRAHRSVPASSSLVSRPEGVYLAEPGQVIAYEPRTLARQRSIPVDSSGDSFGLLIAADPRSSVLWIDVSRQGDPEVEAISLTTGRPLGRAHFGAVCCGSPQGFGDDAWVIYPTGMLSGVIRFAPNGRRMAEPDNVGPNASGEQVTGRHLWIYQALGNDAEIDCRALSTGAEQAHATIHGSTANPARFIGADNTHVYVETGTTVVAYRPTGPCN
jgi:hypothetical protein